MLTIILAVLLAIVLFVWHYYLFSYWKRHNVKFVKPAPIRGNANLKISFFDQIHEIYKSEGFENEPVVAAYLMHRPILVLRDLDLIKRIMIKNFYDFADHVITPDAVHDRLAAENLFFTNATKWKALRPRLTPLLSSGKIKQMYMLMKEVNKLYICIYF